MITLRGHNYISTEILFIQLFLKRYAEILNHNYIKNEPINQNLVRIDNKEKVLF